MCLKSDSRNRAGSINWPDFITELTNLIPDLETPGLRAMILRAEGDNFSADETANVGIDLATPVVESIGAEGKSRFTSRIRKIVVEVK
jgi:hypothetical protein